jgi:hypothetical protein
MFVEHDAAHLWTRSWALRAPPPVSVREGGPPRLHAPVNLPCGVVRGDQPPADLDQPRRVARRAASDARQQYQAAIDR